MLLMRDISHWMNLGKIWLLDGEQNYLLEYRMFGRNRGTKKSLKFDDLTVEWPDPHIL